jgi:hypothetical protein
MIPSIMASTKARKQFRAFFVFTEPDQFMQIAGTFHVWGGAGDPPAAVSDSLAASPFG